MTKELTCEKKQELIDRMVDNLPALRASCGLSQMQLAERIGMHRQVMVFIETRNRVLKWRVYLAILFVFLQYKQSADLIKNLELHPYK